MTRWLPRRFCTKYVMILVGVWTCSSDQASRRRGRWRAGSAVEVKPPNWPSLYSLAHRAATGIQHARINGDTCRAGILSFTSVALRECLSGGTAFHNTNLMREEQAAVDISANGTEGLRCTAFSSKTRARAPPLKQQSRTQTITPALLALNRRASSSMDNVVSDRRSKTLLYVTTLCHVSRVPRM